VAGSLSFVSQQAEADGIKSSGRRSSEKLSRKNAPGKPNWTLKNENRTVETSEVVQGAEGTVPVAAVEVLWDRLILASVDHFQLAVSTKQLGTVPSAALAPESQS
jgi:hypothetical protein